MNAVDASTLLVKIEQTWPTPRWSNAKLDMWREDLLTLGDGEASTAFVQLRRTLKECPTFAELRTAAKALHLTDGGTVREPCRFCENSGWVMDDGFTKLGYTQVKPCECSEGDGPRHASARPFDR